MTRSWFARCDGMTRAPTHGLKASTRHRDQVLLQRVDAKGVLNFVVVEPAVRPVGPGHEFCATAKERRGHTKIREGRVVEVAEHGSRVRELHRKLMMRPGPSLQLVPMTAAAFPRSDKGG